MAATELCSAVSYHGHLHHLPKDYLLAFCNSSQSNHCGHIFQGFTAVTDIAGGFSTWRENELPTAIQ